MSAFAGQVAVVTGATGGIGSAVAARLIAAGATVALVARCRQLLESYAVDPAANARVTRWSADLGVESDVTAVAERICETYPQIDILVHAAGTIGFGSIEESPAADFDAQYRVNVRAPYQLTQALLPRLLACGGHVVFINSSVVTGGRAGLSQYAATKQALRALADSLRDEVNPRGMRVTSIFLGRTASNMQAAVHRREGRTYHPERFIQPDDVASVVVGALQLPRTAEVTDIHLRPMVKP
jgi:NADP-dependent 3-hydroxy acid dehydrogenase YdfG